MFSKANPKQRALVISFIILGILFSIFFGMRAFRSYKKFNGHQPPPPGKVETDVELIRNWMTIPFISELYQIPEPVIFDALKIPPQENREKSLKDLNHDYYPDADGFVLDTVKVTILSNQSSLPHDDSVPTPATP
jgi:hypothetical protein